MTIGAWVVWIIISACFIILAMCIISYIEASKTNIICIIALAIVLSLGVLAGMFWWYGNTASGSRALKTQKSNFSNGINRKVTVYDMNGGIIQQYEGKFDVEYDDDRILFDDEKGLRHIIYYPTGTIIIDEIEK